MSRVLTFKLGANLQLPEPDWRPTVTFNPPPNTASDEVLAEGLVLYQDLCMGCHGLNAVSGLLIPDLRGSALIHDQSAWDSIVRGGALRAKGMASFETELDEEQSDAIRAYIIQQAIRGQAIRAAQ